MARRRLGLARRDALGARLARELLGGDLAVAVHQDDERLALARPPSPASSSTSCSGTPIEARGMPGAAMLDVFELVLGVFHAVLREKGGGRRVIAMSGQARTQQAPPVTRPAARRSPAHLLLREAHVDALADLQAASTRKARAPPRPRRVVTAAAVRRRVERSRARTPRWRSASRWSSGSRPCR